MPVITDVAPREMLQRARSLTELEREIWLEVFEGEYPDPADTNSYTSLPELRRIAHALSLPPGGHLLDVGCGRGGPGRFLARETGARLTGIDVSYEAIKFASLRSAGDPSHTFRVGTFEQPGLPERSVDGVVSIDAIFYAEDKRRALLELARVLKPGGRLVFTSWDYSDQPHRRPAQLEDHRPILTSLGLEVLQYLETPRWRERQQQITARLLLNADEFARQVGKDPLCLRSDLQEIADMLPRTRRRVLAVCRRVPALCPG